MSPDLNQNPSPATKAAVALAALAGGSLLWAVSRVPAFWVALGLALVCLALLGAGRLHSASSQLQNPRGQAVYAAGAGLCLLLALLAWRVPVPAPSLHQAAGLTAGGALAVLGFAWWSRARVHGRRT